jgi:hypothetical protein
MTETARAAVDAGAPRLWPGLALLVGAAMLVLLLPPGAVLERLPSLHVKGKEEPIQAYVLHGLAPT